MIFRDMLSPKERIFTSYSDMTDLFICPIREYAYQGLPDPETRAIVWKLLLNVLPLNPTQWNRKHLKNLQTYTDFVNDFVVTPNRNCGKENCNLVPNPIDLSWKEDDHHSGGESEDESSVNPDQKNESKWSRDFGYSDMREAIWKDVERTYADYPFFHEHNRQVLARLLFVYVNLNKCVNYVQGMNELMAPLLYVFAENDLDREVSMEVEADTFFAFNTLASELQNLYIKHMDSTSLGL